MVVAVVLVRVVQVVPDQKVDVVAVRDVRVAAALTVHVSVVVGVAAVLRRAGGGVLRVDLEHVLVHMVAVGMVEMTVMQVVHVAIVLHCDVAAVRAVLVRVLVMRLVRHAHEDSRSRAGAPTRCEQDRFSQF